MIGEALMARPPYTSFKSDKVVLRPHSKFPSMEVLEFHLKHYYLASTLRKAAFDAR